MKKLCRICGKAIIGDVLKHYADKHFSIYVANKAKIESHPGAFVVSGCSELLAALSIVKNCAPPKKAQPPSPKIDKKRMKEIAKTLDKRLGEQTYRGNQSFMCDGCHKEYKYGKVIYGNAQNFHLCYECYKYAKKGTDSKRGNKHVFINTPM